MATLAGKKRPLHAEDAIQDDPSSPGLLQAQSTPSAHKKARFQIEDDDDRTSVLSLTETNAATATIGETDTPHTEASSVRSGSRPRPKKYHCTFPNCTKAFDRPVRLQTHINSHTGERPHACPHDDCDKRFLKPEHLNRHVKEKHSDQTFVCTHKVRKDDTGLIEECGKVFHSNTKLKRHVAMHEEKEETTCTWEGCGKVFRRQDTLQRHIKKDHLNEDSYMCSREIAAGEICGQTFPTPGQLRGHEAREHAAPKYICQICTNAMIPPPQEMREIDNGLDPAFLPTLEDLQQFGHEFDPNAIGNLSLEEGSRPGTVFVPEVVAFPTYHDLQRHLRDTHPPICGQCGKKCKSGKDLTAHIDIEHSITGGPDTGSRPQTEKKFLCPFEDCPRSVAGNGFTKKGNMDVHIKSRHTMEKKFVCGEYDLDDDKRVEGWDRKGCGIAFGAKQSLIGHVRTQHLNLPAALGSKTGLQERDRKRKTNSQKMKMDDADEDAMITDDVTGAPSKAVSMLTGAGYEQLRPFACLMAAGRNGCQLRFTKEYELCTHMELTHGWNVDDINDALGNQMECLDGDTEDATGQALRRELEEHIGGFNVADQGRSMIDPQLTCA